MLLHPKDLYTGVIFKKSLNLANRIGGDILILSGKYGLITPDTIIEPYEYGIEGPIFHQKYPKEEWPHNRWFHRTHACPRPVGSRSGFGPGRSSTTTS